MGEQPKLPNIQENNSLPKQDSQSSQEAEVSDLESLKNYPFEQLQKEGWKPRIKKSGKKQYILLQGRIKDKDDKWHVTDRSLGPYSPEKWVYVSKFFPEKPPDEEILGRNEQLGNDEVLGNPEGLGSDEAEDRKLGNEGIIDDDMPLGRTVEREVQLPKDKATKLFTTVVTRHSAIPASISYGSDIVVYFEFFQANGYVGNINDWMHEAVRNYLAEHYCKMHMNIGKPQGELNE